MFTKKINIPSFLVATLLVVIATFIAFFFAFAKDEGASELGLIASFIAKSFFVFRFPTHSLFAELFVSSAKLYWLGLFLNSILYGLLIERIITLLVKRKYTPS